MTEYAIPRPDGGQWPDLYEAVTDTLTSAGFHLGMWGLVHVDVNHTRAGGRIVTLTLEPSSDEEIGRILAALAAADLRPAHEAETATLALRRSQPAAIVYAPATAPPEPQPEPEPEREEATA